MGLLFATLAASAAEPAMYGETRLSPADYARAKQPGRCFTPVDSITPEGVGAAARCSLARDAMAGIPPPPPIKDCKDVTPADHVDDKGFWRPIICRGKR